jgi:hypothetical protein
LWGLEPTDEEAAEIAEHVYEGKKGSKLSGGWEMIDVYDSKENPGYRAGLYKRKKKDGEFEYVMANAGTDDMEDMLENIEQVFGGSEHMELSTEKAKELDAQLNDQELTFVGHSKGGAEAAGNALATNRNAKVFNPAAINASAYGLDSKNYTANMTAFIVTGDILHSNLNSWLSRPIDKAVFLPRQHGSFWDKGALKVYNQYLNHRMKSVKKALIHYNK